MTNASIMEVAKNRIIQTITVAELLRLLGRSGVWVFIPLYLLKEHFANYNEIGILFMLGAFASIPPSLLGGNLIDKIGRRIVALILPPLLSFLFLLMFLDIYYHLNIVITEITFILFAPVASLQAIVDSVIVTDSTIESDRVNAFSMTRIGANVGFSLGPAIAGFALAYSYAILPLIPMLSELIGFSLYFKYIRYKEVPTQKERELISFPRNDMMFLAISLLISLAWFSVGPWAYVLPQFLNRIDLINYSTIGLLIASNGIAVVLLQVPVNRFLGSMNEIPRISLGLIIYAATFAVLGFTRNIMLLLVDIIILTVGENVMSPASNSIIGKIAPEDERGKYYGGFSLINSFMGPFSPVVYEFMLSALFRSPTLLWGSIGSICLILALTILSTRKRFKFKN